MQLRQHRGRSNIIIDCLDIAAQHLDFTVHHCVLCYAAAYAAYMHSTTVAAPSVHYVYAAYMHSTTMAAPTVHFCVLWYKAACAAYMHSTTVPVPTVRDCVLCRTAAYAACTLLCTILYCSLGCKHAQHYCACAYYTLCVLCYTAAYAACTLLCTIINYSLCCMHAQHYCATAQRVCRREAFCWSESIHWMTPSQCRTESVSQAAQRVCHRETSTSGLRASIG